MYEALGAAAGAGAGGMLGQMGEALSMPRKALWRMFGAPEEGNELISNLTGLDKESLLAKALGMGTEMALDPLNLVGAGVGALAGGGIRNAKNLNKMNSLMDEIPLADEAIDGLNQAADAQRVADYAAESTRLKSIDPYFGTPTAYKPGIMAQVPELDEIAKIASRTEMPGSGLTAGGMKSYPNYSDDAARLMEQDYLGGVNPLTEALEVMPRVRTDTKAYKITGPPSLNVRGNKAVLDPLARSPIPDEFMPDMPPSLMPAGRGYPRVQGGMAGMPESAAEARLRMQAGDIGMDKQRIMQVLEGMNDPDKIGMIEELFRSGPNSPLGQALLAGTAAGGSMYFGSQMMGK